MKEKILLFKLPDGNTFFITGESWWQLKKVRKQLKEVYPIFDSRIIPHDKGDFDIFMKGVKKIWR
jgi:hypothetical protein